MITYFKRHEINDTKWNAALAGSSNALIYAATYYLDAVCPQWAALVLDDYSAIMPLTQNSKMGFGYLYQPYFAQQLGIFAAEKISPEVVEEFIRAIPTKFRFIEICLNANNAISGLTGNFKLTERINFELDLNKPFSEISKGFSDNLNRNYKKAVQHDLSITEQLSVNDFMGFCRAHSDTIRLNHSLVFLLEKVVNAALTNKAGKLTGICDKTGKLCAVNLFLTDFKRVINLFPVSSNEGQKNGAMTFLLFNQIMQLSGTDNVFDYEGSMIDGVARFYRSFGARQTTYFHIRRNLLPWYIKWIKG